MLCYLTGAGDITTSGVTGAVTAVVTLQAACAIVVFPRPDIIACK